jgi:hypoxanthine phosphoribosyltransferase
MDMEDRELVISREAIAQRLNELGRQITDDYRGKELAVIGVLKGAFVFMADLIRAIELEVVIDFLQVSSYGPDTKSSGHVRISKDLDLDIGGRDVLLVEDIIDTGHTLACLQDLLARRAPRSIRVCVLIDKQERRQKSVAPEYVGFKVENGFLVGYGLDYGERHRQHPEVFRLERR